MYVFLFFRKGFKLLWCVRQRGVRRQVRFWYWPITSSLDHSTLCYLQDPLSTSASRPGLLNWRPLWIIASSGVFLLTASWFSLWPSLFPTNSTATGICIYYFMMPSYFRLDHVIFIRSFTQVHLWLTTRSRVNM